MSLSIIIPCRNEENGLEKTVNEIIKNIKVNEYEILIIDDFSSDLTPEITKRLSEKINNLKYFKNNSKGLGGAINKGINEASKKNICFFMADMSDDVNDLNRYYEILIKDNLDAVLGSRFISGSKVFDYPKSKLILNRVFNYFVKIIFFSNYNDFTNAFKIYKLECLKDLKPLVSENFNIFLEMPLKVISRNYEYKITPINWTNRKEGEAKFKIKELSSKYIFTLIYCFIEKILLKKSKNKVIN